MDFVAIDFETANHRPNSACQVAAVVVHESRIVDQRSWLVRPPSDYFAPINISIHGIRPSDVKSAPTMEEVWLELSELIDGQIMFAHNARFDMGVLVASLAAHDVACPSFEFQCTRVLARATWPQRTRYGLKPLGSWLGISFRHHDALEDARCCAEIALAAESVSGCLDSLEALEARLSIQRAYYKNQRIVSPKMLKPGRDSRSRRFSDQASGSFTKGKNADRQYADRWGFPIAPGQQPHGSVDVELIRQSTEGLPLAGKNIVMLGPLRGLSLDQTRQLLRELGATVQDSIVASTDLVVAAGTPLSDARNLLPQHEFLQQPTTMPPPTDNRSGCSEGLESSSYATAKSSQGIRVLSERQFRAMLPGGLG
jgi:DNA polymerase-3 subunit epsilon